MHSEFQITPTFLKMESISPIGLSLMISIMTISTIEGSYHLPIQIWMLFLFYVDFGIYIL